jgi:hypothetical protein
MHLKVQQYTKKNFSIEQNNVFKLFKSKCGLAGQLKQKYAKFANCFLISQISSKNKTLSPQSAD